MLNLFYYTCLKLHHQQWWIIIATCLASCIFNLYQAADSMLNNHKSQWELSSTRGVGGMRRGGVAGKKESRKDGNLSYYFWVGGKPIFVDRSRSTTGALCGLCSSKTKAYTCCPLSWSVICAPLFKWSHHYLHYLLLLLPFQSGRWFIRLTIGLSPSLSPVAASSVCVPRW